MLEEQGQGHQGGFSPQSSGAVCCLSSSRFITCKSPVTGDTVAIIFLKVPEALLAAGSLGSPDTEAGSSRTNTC